MSHQYVTEIFPTNRGDPPPEMQTPPCEGGAAKAKKKQATLVTAVPSTPQGGARWMLS